MKHVVIDLEMNGIAKEYRNIGLACDREVIEIGAVVLDETYQEIGSFKTLVKPRYNDVIEKRITKLTGISTEMVLESPNFEVALREFFQWCQELSDEIQLYQWSESDLAQILKEIEMKRIVLNKKEQMILEGWSDFQREYGEKLNLENSVSLRNAVMYAGIEFEGKEHDALHDARNTATLLKIVRNPELCKKALESVIEALTPTTVSSSLGSLINFAELGFIA